MKALRTLLAAIASAAPCLAAPLHYLDGFSDGIRDPLFTVERSDPHYDYNEAGGTLTLSKQANIASQGIVYRSMFAVMEDFTAQVDCSRLSGNASVGIRARTTNGYVSIYYTTERGSKVYGAWAESTNSASGGQASPPARAPFRIRRENGHRIVAEYTFSGGGWEIMTLRNNLTGPVRIELFMTEESGSDAASAGQFDNLLISAPDFLDLRTTGTTAPSISRAVRIAWPTEINILYQVQWASKLDSNLWSNLKPPTVGNGGESVAYDDEGEQAERYYRILLTP